MTSHPEPTKKNGQILPYKIKKKNLCIAKVLYAKSKVWQQIGETFAAYTINQELIPLYLYDIGFKSFYKHKREKTNSQ